MGDLAFTLGLALALHSKLGWLLFIANAVLLRKRVLEDEERLRRRFGPEYEHYRQRVKRWIPFVL
jgi:protein-S-isoprenylcysteine O-methyltransferase Ste14